MRGTPIFTFVNKCDRPGADPLELMDELEHVLGIRCYPMNWPIHAGDRFRGVYDRTDQRGPPLRARRGPRRGRGERAGRSRWTTSASTTSLPRASSRSCARTSSCWTSAGTSSPARRSGGAADAHVLRQRDDQLRRAAVPACSSWSWRRRRASRESSTGTVQPHRPEVRRLRLQDPGEHGPHAPRPHRLRARVLGALRGGDEVQARAAGQGGAPGEAQPVPGRASARRSRTRGPAT